MSEDQRPPDDSSPAKRLGDFDLLREIGRGGMGVVYEARQISLKRRVALKVLPPVLSMSAQAKQRFEREAQAAAKLHHTHIVPVHAIGEHDGHHFYAMDLIDGQSLDHVLRDMMDEGANPLMETAVTQTATELRPQRTATSSQEQATTSLSDTSAGGREWFDAVAKLMAEVADGLHYAHGRGVIHRDVKPANLMLSREGHLSITDFGLARLLEEPGMTVSGSFLGTPAYMAPEQIAAGRINVDHRADIYSLGAVLYEMLTMQRPFGGESREQVLAAVMTKDPRPPRRFNGKIPVDLETICLKALEKDPDRRYASAGELAQDLRQHLQGGVIAARRAGIARRTWKSIRRHPTATLGVVGVLVVGLLVGFGWQAIGQARVPRLVSQAQLVTERGEYREGMALAEAALALDPDNPDARLVRARTLILGGRHVEAIEEAREVLRIDADNWAAHMLIATAARSGVPSIDASQHLAAVEGLVPDSADAFYLRGKLANSNREAIKWLDRALELDRGHILALGERIERHLFLKNLPAALADSERVLAVRPRSALGYVWVAEVYGELHDEARAAEACDRAIEVDPEYPFGYYGRAILQGDWVRGHIDEAIADVTRAIELDPNVPDFFDFRASQYNSKKDYDKAIADSKRALELNPDLSWAFDSLARAYRSTGRRDEARDVVQALSDRAATWHDKNARAFAIRIVANFHHHAGDYELALAEAEKIIHLQPNELTGYYMAARARSQLEGESAIEEDCDRMAGLEFDEPAEFHQRANTMMELCRPYDQALADNTRAIELAPNWAEPYYQRGIFYLWRLKDYEKAFAELDKAIELAPAWGVAVLVRAQFFLLRERFDEALADIERCLELGTDGSYLRWFQAQALLRLGRESEAFAVLDGYLEKNPKDELTLSNKAEALFWLGRVDEAIATLDQAIEADPAKPLLYHFRAEISTFREGACDRVEADLAKYRELAADGAETWSILAAAHVYFLYDSCTKLYDPASALELARKAVAVDSGYWWFHENLGCAAYRNGSYEEARDELLMAEELAFTESNAVVRFFFLAMTLEKLGDGDDARRWYDRAVARMDETYPENPELIAVKQEAAELLGVQP